MSRSDIQKLAQEFAQHGKNSTSEWADFLLENLHSLEKFQPTHFAHIKNHVRSIREFFPLIELLSTPHPENPIQKTYLDLFVSRVDESTHDMRQWLEALGVFSEWLARHNRQTSSLKMLGYLECCAKSIEGKVYPLELKDLCQEMLTQYGYLG